LKRHASRLWSSMYRVRTMSGTDTLWELHRER